MPIFLLCIANLWNLVNKISREPLELRAFYRVMQLVNKISGEPLELGSLYQAYRCDEWCRWPDYFLRKILWIFDKILWIFDWIVPLFRLRHLTLKEPCEQNIRRTNMNNGSLKFVLWPRNTEIHCYILRLLMFLQWERYAIWADWPNFLFISTWARP